MFGKFMTWIGLAILCSVVIKVMLLLDLNKKVYNHVPGLCRYVRGVADGSEDLELLPDGKVIISGGLRFTDSKELGGVKGQLFIYDLKGTPSYQATPLKIHGSGLDPKLFNPHGISSFTSKGRTTLYVINHLPGEDVVECLTLNPDKKSLTHTKTIRSSAFYGLNDLAAVGPDKFYVSNYQYFRQSLLRKLETILMLNLGNLLYFDGKAVVQDNWMLTPNGVAVSPDKLHLYVAQPLQESIRVYNISRDGSLIKVADMTLLTSPDNIFVEAEKGELWVGSHPLAHEIFRHLDSPKSVPAPSQVLHIRLQGAHDRWVVTEPYANDGVTGDKPLWGSSAAVFHNEQLLVGTVAHKLLHCSVLNPDLA